MSRDVCPVQQHTTFQKGTLGTLMGLMFSKLDNIETLFEKLKIEE